jgi:hypothetical protein
MEPAYKTSFEDDEFDMVVCSEVMEHIPEELTADTLKEIYRIGSDKFIFTIALKPEKIKLAGFVQSHITLHDPNWWIDRFEDAGFTVLFCNSNEEGDDVSLYAVKDAVPYTEGTRKLSKHGEDFPMLVMGGIPVGEKVEGIEYAL